VSIECRTAIDRVVKENSSKYSDFSLPAPANPERGRNEEMITSWDIYWITRLDEIHGICWFLVIAAAITIAVLLAMAVWAADQIEPEKAKKRLSLSIKMAVFACTIFIFGSFVPSTKDFAAIYLIPKIANNEQVQKVPENLVRLLNTKMEAWITDMTPQKAKK